MVYWMNFAVHKCSSVASIFVMDFICWTFFFDHVGLINHYYGWDITMSLRFYVKGCILLSKTGAEISFWSFVFWIGNFLNYNDYT
jgi:hypothetical protein